MKKIIFGNSLMLLGLSVLYMSAWEVLPGVVSWVSVFLLPIDFILAVVGFVSDDKDNK